MTINFPNINSIRKETADVSESHCKTYENKISRLFQNPHYWDLEFFSFFSSLQQHLILLKSSSLLRIFLYL